MSRLTSIFRRRGDETGPGQETEGQPAAASVAPTAPETPSFHDRGRLRRRLRYLRRVRELQLRDLGGLVYETHRMSRPRQDLVQRKVSALAATDAEMTGLEHALDDIRPLLELREPGIGGQCPRCGELFGSDARFCSHCGAGLAGEAEAARGQSGAAGATPGAAPAGAAAVPGAAPATPGATPGGVPAGSPASPGAAPGGSPKLSRARPIAPPGTPAPAASPAASPSPAAAPQPQAPMPKAPPPSGSQGIGSGDPLGQAPAAPPEQPTVAISSGDPLAAKPAPAKPDAKPAESPVAEQAPAGGDETGVVPPSEEGDAGANGADESRPAKARAAGAQDEPE